jgi:hypothetical protein
VGRVWSAQGQNTDEDNEGAEDKKRHSPKTNFLDPPAQAAINKKEVENDAKEKRCNRQRETMGKEGAIGGDPYERGV